MRQEFATHFRRQTDPSWLSASAAQARCRPPWHAEAVGAELSMAGPSAKLPHRLAPALVASGCGGTGGLRRLRPMTVVTGASQGIGLALARHFARCRHDLLLIARRPEPLEQAAAGIRAECKVEVATLPLDITAPDAIARIEAALAQHGTYADVLVNSAGMGLAGPVSRAIPRTRFTSLWTSTCALLPSPTRHFLAGMRMRGRGGILNLASLGGYAPGPYQAAYYASKAYVISLSEALAAETAGQGVRVCALAPGPVHTVSRAHARRKRPLSAASACRRRPRAWPRRLSGLCPGLARDCSGH